VPVPRGAHAEDNAINRLITSAAIPALAGKIEAQVSISVGLAAGIEAVAGKMKAGRRGACRSRQDRQQPKSGSSAFAFKNPLSDIPSFVTETLTRLRLLGQKEKLEAKSRLAPPSAGRIVYNPHIARHYELSPTRTESGY
jgi:hypothetical protein